MTALRTLQLVMIQAGHCVVSSAPAARSQHFVPAACRSRLWAPVLVLLLLATTAWSAQAAELRIGDAQGYPGDTVELTLSLQGDGATVSADFLIERSYVANFSTVPATVLAPGVSCTVEGRRFRVIWNGVANTGLIDICVIRMTIFNEDPRFNPSVFGASQQCLDANDVAQPCSIARGRIDVIHEIDRSFIAVLRHPPDAPSMQDVVDFDYEDIDATAPLGFVDAVRPEYVRGPTPVWQLGEYGEWLLANPQSPIALLHHRGARFTFTTLEQRAQALASARSDPAVLEIVESLGLAGPQRTYPVLPRENQPFGLYLVGPSCPSIWIATPERRSIEIVGNQIGIVLHSSYRNRGCVGVPPSGHSTAVVQIPGLAAGTYTVIIQTAAGPRGMELVVHPGSLAMTEPRQIPNPDVRLWMVLGILILAVRRLSTPAC